jgi:hypothetical protein
MRRARTTHRESKANSITVVPDVPVLIARRRLSRKSSSEEKRKRARSQKQHARRERKMKGSAGFVRAALDVLVPQASGTQSSEKLKNNEERELQESKSRPTADEKQQDRRRQRSQDNTWKSISLEDRTVKNEPEQTQRSDEARCETQAKNLQLQPLAKDEALWKSLAMGINPRGMELLSEQGSQRRRRSQQDQEQLAGGKLEQRPQQRQPRRQQQQKQQKLSSQLRQRRVENQPLPRCVNTRSSQLPQHMRNPDFKHFEDETSDEDERRGFSDEDSIYTPFTTPSFTHRKKTSARQPTLVTSEKLRQDTIMNDGGEEDYHDDNSNVTTVITKSNKETVMTTTTAGAVTARQATVMVEQYPPLPLANASPDLRTRKLVARYLADLQPTCAIQHWQLLDIDNHKDGATSTDISGSKKPPLSQSSRRRHLMNPKSDTNKGETKSVVAAIECHVLGGRTIRSFMRLPVMQRLAVHRTTLQVYGTIVYENEEKETMSGTMTRDFDNSAGVAPQLVQSSYRYSLQPFRDAVSYLIRCDSGIWLGGGAAKRLAAETKRHFWMNNVFQVHAADLNDFLIKLSAKEKRYIGMMRVTIDTHADSDVTQTQQYPGLRQLFRQCHNLKWIRLYLEQDTASLLHKSGRSPTEINDVVESTAMKVRHIVTQEARTRELPIWQHVYPSILWALNDEHFDSDAELGADVEENESKVDRWIEAGISR